MGMNRLLEHSPSEEGALVSRVLVQLHKAIDKHFPAAFEAERRFTKTEFSDSSNDEGTAIVRDEEGEFTADADTNPVGVSPQVPEQGGVSLHPSQPQQPSGPNESGPDGPHSYISHLDPLASKHETEAAMAAIEEDETNTLRGQVPVDWGTRFLLAALLAGIVILAYVLLV